MPSPRTDAPAPVAPAQPAAGETATPAFEHTVSVRSLCEFTCKHGDLDRRFTPSATALEGMAGQAAVAARRGPQYQTEVVLEGSHRGLRVRGRADGHDSARACLEEIKTIRGEPEDMAENRRHLHWAQLETYGALFCRERSLQEIDLCLVYVDAATQAETVLQERRSAAELEAAFIDRCERFLAWARQEATHLAARRAGLAALPFPPGEFRAGQRLLSESVYRAATAGRCLLAQAPTGIGKTLGTLYPMLRAVPGQGLDKVVYLTCKGTGRLTALDALQRLRDATPGQALRVLALVSREQACEHPDKACHGESCPLARGFHDRLPAARADAVAAGWLDPAAQRRIALHHGMCPYFLGQELLRWVDVVVGDVHHLFDPHGQLHHLAQAMGWRLGVLVDEAHNLVERARQMHSAQLSLAQIRAASRQAPATVRPHFGRLQRAAEDMAAAMPACAHLPLDKVPEPFAQALQALVAALGDHLQTQSPVPGPGGPLLNFYFDALRMQRLVERFGTHSLFDVQQGEDASGPAKATAARAHSTVQAEAEAPRASTRSLFEPPASEPLSHPLDSQAGAWHAGAEPSLVFSLRNVVPGPFLQGRFAACHSVTLFSATLGSMDYQRDLLGLPENTAWLDVPPVFAPENLSVRVARGVSTRYADRSASLDKLVALMARQCETHPGNYLAFFSSFEYLEQAAARLRLRRPGLPVWSQSRAMGPAVRERFLDRFEIDGQGIGFAVLGGAFAEGVDLPGSRLIGAFVATLGLPPVSPVQEQMRLRLDTVFGAGHGYADLLPGLQKVVQAAGRVLRTPQDRGWLWLIDDRYHRPEVRALLPSWWQIVSEPAG